MQPLALSTRWNAHRHQDGLEMLQQIRRLGFRAVEISSNVTTKQWDGVIKAREKNIIDIVAVQNEEPFFNGNFLNRKRLLDFSNEREDIRLQARQVTETTIRKASAVGARAVLIQLGKSGQTGVTTALERMNQRGKYLEKAYAEVKVQAVQARSQLFPELWKRLKTDLYPLVELAAEKKILLALETRGSFEEIPHEEEMEQILAAFPAHVVGYWHNFGLAARKDFLGWLTHEETLARRVSRLAGCHVQDWRRGQTTCLPLSHGEIEYSPLLPLLPSNAMAVLELDADTPEEQVMASRHLWNSYVDALV